MKYIFLFLYLSLHTIIKSKPPEGYSLVWSDEFDDASLDTSKWVYNTGAEPNLNYIILKDKKTYI